MPGTHEEYIRTLQELVGEAYGLTVEEVKSGRAGLRGEARAVVSYIAVQSGFTSERVGQLVGRHHSTIHIQCRTIQQRLAGDPDLLTLVRSLPKYSRTQPVESLREQLLAGAREHERIAKDLRAMATAYGGDKDGDG